MAAAATRSALPSALSSSSAPAAPSARAATGQAVPPILLCIILRSPDGEEMKLTVDTGTPMRKVMGHFCTEGGFSNMFQQEGSGDLRAAFAFEGIPIEPGDTCTTLEIPNGGIISVAIVGLCKVSELDAQGHGLQRRAVGGYLRSACIVKSASEALSPRARTM
eukprot:UN1081